MQRNTNTTRLVMIAFLLAIEIILSTYLTINVAGIAKIGLGFLPIAMIAILYGPVWSGFTYALGDILAYFIKPEGPYFPGFTVTALLVGMVMGFFLYKKEIGFLRAMLCAFVVVLFMDFFLNTFWLHILYGQGFLILLPTRIVKCILQFIFEAILIPLVWNKVMLHIPQVKNTISIR